MLDKLRQQSAELERLARQDPLTQLYNRGYLEENPHPSSLSDSKAAPPSYSSPESFRFLAI